MHNNFTKNKSQIIFHLKMHFLTKKANWKTPSTSEAPVVIDQSPFENL